MSSEIIRTNFLLSIDGEIYPIMREIRDGGEKGGTTIVPTFSFRKDGSVASRRDSEDDKVEPEKDWVDKIVEDSIAVADSKKDVLYVSVIRVKNKPKEVGIVCSDYPMEVEEIKITCISAEREG